MCCNSTERELGVSGRDRGWRDGVALCSVTLLVVAVAVAAVATLFAARRALPGALSVVVVLVFVVELRGWRIVAVSVVVGNSAADVRAVPGSMLPLVLLLV
jgi:hypothetical protein